MKKLYYYIIAAVIPLILAPGISLAAGISVDAGLTPAEDRWIIRSQIRYMNSSLENAMGDNEMTMYGVPLVVAYGVRNYIMVMVRQPIMFSRMSMMGSSANNSGLGDFYLMAKYKAYRINTSSYTFGIAPTLGISMPTGAESFTSDTWDLNFGLYFSGRLGRLASDFNLGYLWSDFSGKNNGGINRGNEISLDWAGSHQIPLNSVKSTTLAPLVELSYWNILKDKINGIDVSNTGEELLYVSPGLKYTIGSTIFETLLRIPVWQNQYSDQLERQIGFISGVRVML